MLRILPTTVSATSSAYVPGCPGLGAIARQGRGLHLGARALARSEQRPPPERPPRSVRQGAA
eukprot:15455081-Alexandrium_andersonii.AAC.1